MSLLAILINAAIAYVAFHFARNGENVVSRVLSLGYLIARGGLLLFVGTLSVHGLIPSLLGISMLTLAGVAWWQGRS